jgi:hypothetical protein
MVNQSIGKTVTKSILYPYQFSFLETRNPSTGTKDTVASRILSLNISNLLSKFSILDVGIQVRSYNLNCEGLSEEMYEDGYQHITNIDISFTVIK